MPEPCKKGKHHWDSIDGKACLNCDAKRSRVPSSRPPKARAPMTDRQKRRLEIRNPSSLVITKPSRIAPSDQ
jgi:hypothetical protein